MAILIIWAPSLASLHMAFPLFAACLSWETSSLVCPASVAQLCGTFLGWALSAATCLSLTSGWPHVFRCWKLSCYVWLLLSLKQYCIGNVNENFLQTFQLKTKHQDHFKGWLVPTVPPKILGEKQENGSGIFILVSELVIKFFIPDKYCLFILCMSAYKLNSDGVRGELKLKQGIISVLNSLEISQLLVSRVRW